MTVEVIPEIGKKRKHKWGEPVSIHASESPSKCNQTERTCVQCQIVRITVHADDGKCWREWRHPSSKNQFAMPATPPCVERKE